jgi:hypothetical protein
MIYLAVSSLVFSIIGISYFVVEQCIYNHSNFEKRCLDSKSGRPTLEILSLFFYMDFFVGIWGVLFVWPSAFALFMASEKINAKPWIFAHLVLVNIKTLLIKEVVVAKKFPI